MKILIACEESQEVCKAFRAKDHEAYSCDILPPSGGKPEWHLQCDVQEVLDKDWDMVIAHPPCDHLASSGARWFKQKIADGRQQQGIDFFTIWSSQNHERYTLAVKVCPLGVLMLLAKTAKRLEVKRFPEQPKRWQSSGDRSVDII